MTLKIKSALSKTKKRGGAGDDFFAHAHILSGGGGSGGGASSQAPPVDDFWNLDLDDIIHGTSTTTSSSNTNIHFRKNPPRVRFDSVSIREYNQILGNNPACEEGPSLALGWKVLSRSKFDIDHYEIQRQKQGRIVSASCNLLVVKNSTPDHPSRSSNASKLRLTTEERGAIAQDWGYSEDAIFENTVRVGFFHKLRNDTLVELHTERLKEWAEAKKKEGSTDAANATAAAVNIRTASKHYVDTVTRLATRPRRPFRKLNTSLRHA